MRPTGAWSFARRYATTASTFLLLCCHTPAQWEIPGPLVLDGPAAMDRQVLGLAQPMDSSDAVSLAAARTNATTRTTVEGTTLLTGVLTPAPAGYTEGLSVVIFPTQANGEAPTLDLNGLGPRPIVKHEDTPLAPGDLRPGIPAQLIFDGTRFQLANALHVPCPAGYTALVSGFCIADQAQAESTFFEATVRCAGQGARLCTLGEWSQACRSLPVFFASVTTAEWVDHGANNANGAKLVGVGIDGGAPLAGAGCEFGGQSPPLVPFRYRCCTNR